MDKAKEGRISYYGRDHQTLCIESRFSGGASLEDLVKDYLLERRRQRKPSGDAPPERGPVKDTARAASTSKGECR